MCLVYILPSYQPKHEELEALYDQPPPFVLLCDFNVYNPLWDVNEMIHEDYVLRVLYCHLDDICSARKSIHIFSRKHLSSHQSIFHFCITHYFVI